MEIKTFEVIQEKQDSIELNGQTVDFTFRFEKATFQDGSEITCFAYTKEGENRPVLFLTNGGPGSGVVWLHLGFCAPRRIQILDDLHPQQSAPFKLEDNPNTLIDVADMVFIDPVGTGYSHINDETKKDYTSVDGDAVSVALFIERWRVEHRMSNRPTYFMGESYGTVRGPALCDALMGGSEAAMPKLAGICLDGIILLGSVVSLMTFDKWPYQPVPASVLNLECCAAAYAYHTGKDAYRYANDALDFAPEYTKALFMGNTLGKNEQEKVADKLHELIGVDKERLLRDHLQYKMEQVLEDTLPGKVIGFYDGRFVMDGKAKPSDIPHPGTIDVVSDDPAMGQFSTLFMQGQELLAAHYDLPKKAYPLINCGYNEQWDCTSRHSSINSLENAQRRSPQMRILFANGLLDMCTVPGGVHFVVSQSDLDLNRVTMKEYLSGHMAYLGEENGKALSNDVRQFLLNK